MRGRIDGMDTLLGGFIILLGFGSALAYVPLQIYAGYKWQGGWRIAALMPLLLMVPIFVVTARAFAEESNLWPILLLFASPIATIYLVLLSLFRK